MNKQAISKAFKNVPKFLKKHSPEILTGIGIAGMVVTTITAVKATPKALQLVDEKEIKDGKRLTTKEVVKTTWRCYVPATITGVCSIACLVGASSVNARRNAALATAYAISVQDLADYKKKAVEVVGEKKEQTIRDAMAKERLEETLSTKPEFVTTGKGETLCLDYLTKRTFKADIELLRRAENNLNKRMRDEVRITVNDFFDEIGLEPCDTPLGENMGWDIDKGYIDLDFSAQLVDGVPYLVVGHHVPPQYIGWG